MSDLIGKTIAGRYNILELIGTGGMASVYKAECTLLKRDVAIKILREGLKDDEMVVKSFKQEAQASAKLSHHNIVSVFDVGEENGMDYMVMEYVNGSTLKQYIKQKGSLPWQEVCDFGIQIGQALECAHSKGIVHRDIKPQNILMTEDKQLKVTDFGIAKAAATETMIAGGKNAMGSVHYISPEQARGGYTDARSDIYSLGVVLFEMLTGRVPFDGESAVAIALAHIEREAPSILSIKSDIPSDLAKIVEKCMSKEQSNRYQSINDLVDDLRAVLAKEPLNVQNNDIEDDELGQTRKIEIPEERKVKPSKKGKKQKTPAEKKADKTATILAIVTIILVFVLGFGGYMFIKHGSGEIMVPDFKNMLLEDAINIADEKGIKISDELEYALSDEVEEGKIISQIPEAKKFMKKSEPIRVVVSIGSSGGSIGVPYVKGLSIEDAISKIVDEDLNYIINEEQSDTVAAGTVIRQSPEVGTKLNKDGVVTLHVSSGNVSASPTAQAEVTVPNLLGETHTSAEKILNQKDLHLASVSEKNSDSPAGTIISQSPVAGKKVASGTNVSVVISTGNADAESTFVAPTYAPSKTEATNNNSNSTKTQTPEKSDELVTKTFTLPIPDGEGNATVKITANGDTVYEKSNKRGNNVSVDISGSGKVKIVAFIDGKIVDEQMVDFT